jgi:hypothetical protein
MTLVVEDGTGSNPLANSFISLTDARAYATARGVTLPAVDADCEILAVKAMDYIEGQRDNFKGNRVASTQPLQWPRTGVVIDGFDIAETAIPLELPKAQAQCMCELQAGLELLPTQSDSRVLIRDKVGPLEQEWSDYGGNIPSFPKVDMLMRPLMRNSGFGLTTFRA